jgi:hypothetical protein
VTKSKYWGVFIDIVPLDDLQPHVRGKECWCNPRVEKNGNVVHNAADMREEEESNDQERVSEYHAPTYGRGKTC